MRREAPAGVAFASLVAAMLAIACDSGAASDRVAVPGQAGRSKTAAGVRALRRAYDGAPPVIPHAPMGAACASCHNERGIEVGELGFAPPSPHGDTAGMGGLRCQQCHVFRQTEEVWRESTFVGFAQDLRRGGRLYPGAPPTLPHRVFMRENCLACHSGPAAREEIRTPHPERDRCRQCHVPVVTASRFER